MTKKKIIIIIISILVIIAFIAIITNINKKDNKKNLYYYEDEVLPTNIDWDNMYNAKIDKDGNKICISKDLDKKHVLKSIRTHKNSSLYSDNVKIYGDKKTDVMHIDIPITNTGTEEIKNMNIGYGFYNKKGVGLCLGGFILESIKPNETYHYKFEHILSDVTNTNKYEIWVED